MKTERMTILVTPEQKASILARAQSLGLSAGEMVRRAVASFEPAAARSDDEVVLNALADELFSAAKEARAALCDATKELQSSVRQLAKSRKRARAGV